MTHSPDILRQVDAAVRGKPRFGLTALQERAFARLFTGLVYAQIWEDPVADMAALDLAPGSDILCIASGGCNAMSYLTTKPASVTALDLSPAHVALLRLKQVAAQHLDHHDFHALFARADLPGNAALVRDRLAPHLDSASRAFWCDARPGGARARMFTRGFYRHGVLGRFIGAVHLLAWAARVDFRPLLDAPTLAAQRSFHAAHVDPLFDTWAVRLLARQRTSLFGLGIPPAQYDKLAADGGGSVVAVLRERVRRLMCDFPARDNYFLWQACARGYDPAPMGSLPPYLQAGNFGTVARHAPALRVENRDLTSHLSRRDHASLDAYVLLDAQDWMTDAQLTALWAQITRTARPGARVLFRTGGTADILPGRVPAAVLDQWRHDAAASARAFAQDRSAIYGGVHLYRFAGRAA